MSWFTEPSLPVRKQNWRLCSVSFCILLSCPHAVPLSLSPLLGNKVIVIVGDNNKSDRVGCRNYSSTQQCLAHLSSDVPLHSSLPIQYHHRSACVSSSPCFNFNPRPILPPWPHSSPSNATPQWMLYDKVIQWQLRALITGLNPVSAAASLSLLPLPGLLSPCPTLSAWLTIWLAVAKTKCLPFYYCRSLDNTLLEAGGISLFISPQALKQSSNVKIKQ